MSGRIGEERTFHPWKRSERTGGIHPQMDQKRMKKTLCCLLAIVAFSVMLPAKSLVAYFSQTGEQYGVGVIEKREH